MVDTIWKRKIYDNKKKFYLLPKNSSGEKYERKIKKILSFLKKNRADFQFITASENNAWLFNIRGRDENYTPVPHSHVLIDKNKNIKFFFNLKKIQFHSKKFSKINFIKNLIDKTLSKIQGQKFIIDKNTCSYFLKILFLLITKS